MNVRSLALASLLATLGASAVAQGTSGTSAVAQPAGDWRGSGLHFDSRAASQRFSAWGETPSRDRMAVDAGYRVWRDWGVGGRFATTPRQTLGQTFDTPALTREDTYNVGIWKSDSWLAGDRLSLSVGQGSRSDPLGLGMPSAAAGFGALLRDLPAVGLRPTREVSTELLYTTPLTKSAGLGFSVLNRTRSGLDGPLPDERVMSIRFSTRF